MTIERDDLMSEMDALMRGLRRCDTQATAIAWMTRAYNAMDAATRLIPKLERMAREAESEKAGLVFYMPKPTLEIVQEVPKNIAHRAKTPNYVHNGQTVVYPDFFLHSGLRPAPKAWTRADTLRLERAAREAPKRIVKMGR